MHEEKDALGEMPFLNGSDRQKIIPFFVGHISIS